jgi:release factor glutamine methyltransferase
VGQALSEAIGRLENAGVPEARHDAERLLAVVLSTDRGGVYVRRHEVLTEASAVQYRDRIDLRQTRVPLQHVLGEQEFLGHTFRVDSRALIPRPETEHLVLAALESDLLPHARVVDLGTGTGCIAISLALARPDLQIDAVDRSRDALSLARENASRLGVDRSVSFREADFRRLPGAWASVFDVVVSNPPYVREQDWSSLEPEVRDHDPKEALVAGSVGDECYRDLVPVGRGLLRQGGRLLLELGFGQAEEVRRIVASAGFERVSIQPDFSGIARILSAFVPENGA